MLQDYILKPVRSSLVLTTGYVAGTVLDQNELRNQLVLLVDFTIGSLTDARLKIEVSDDGTTYYQESYENLGTISSITAPFNVYQIEHTFIGTGKYRIPLQIKDRFIKISVKGTGTTTDSLMQIDAVVGLA